MATEAKPNDYQPVRTSSNADGGGKYDVEMWTYPSDLFGTGAQQYGKSWVMININVQKNAEKSEAYGEGVNLNASEKRRYNDATARGQTASSAAATAAGVGASLVTAQELYSGGGKTLAGLLDPKTRAGAVISAASAGAKGAIVGAAAAAPLLVAGTASRETKRIKHAIQLPMPNNLTTAYSADWGEADTRVFDLSMRAPNAAADTIKALFSGKPLPGQLSDAGASLSLGMQGFIGGGGVSAASGLASNPKKEVVFNNMGFRTFTLEYKFFPRDEQEAYKIYYILYHLKYHMHPEYLSKGRFTYVYPSEFDITFFNSDGNELTWVNKIATCVLQNLSVNYTPEGTWAAHNGAAPVAIQAVMTFKELSILTKEQIEMGF